MVLVCAWDRVGFVGGSAGASVVVLDSGSDFDGDGLSSGEEEVSGTDAANPESVFVVGPIEATSPAGSPEIVVRWDSMVGRLYSLYSNSSLTNGVWEAIPAFTNLPGTGGTMSYTGAVDGTVARFYRITVRRD